MLLSVWPLPPSKLALGLCNLGPCSHGPRVALARCGLLHLLLCLAPVWSFGPCVACQYPMDLLHGPALEESSEDAPPLSRSKLADIRGKDVRQERLRLAKIGLRFWKICVEKVISFFCLLPRVLLAVPRWRSLLSLPALVGLSLFPLTVHPAQYNAPRTLGLLDCLA